MSRDRIKPRWRRWALAVIIVGLAAAALWKYVSFLEAPVPIDQPRVVDVPEGASADEVIQLLTDDGLLATPVLARIYVRLVKIDSEFKAGHFEIQPGTSVADMLTAFTVPPEARSQSVTFPEGWRLDQMAARLADRALVEPERFFQALGELGPGPDDTTTGWEGFLFPDTYRVTPSDPPLALIRRMVERREQVWADLWSQHRSDIQPLADRLSLGRTDFVIIASIVEAEGTVPAEYPTIARVIYNRLERGMRLQMDPTCAYPPEYREIPLHRACHDTANPFSTYVIDGLPPTPIGNPGRAALEAALSPDAGEDAAEYLFFVARQDGSGRHAFARTLREHSRNVDRYLRD